MKYKIGILSIVICVLVTGIGLSDIAFSMNKEESVMEWDSYSKEELNVIEAEYRQILKELLSEQGYDNCGITMTYIQEYNEAKTYQIVISHKKLKDISLEEKSILLEQIDLLQTSLNKSNICHKFL